MIWLFFGSITGKLSKFHLPKRFSTKSRSSSGFRVIICGFETSRATSTSFTNSYSVIIGLISVSVIIPEISPVKPIVKNVLLLLSNNFAITWGKGVSSAIKSILSNSISLTLSDFNMLTSLPSTISKPSDLRAFDWTDPRKDICTIIVLIITASISGRIKV